MAGLRHENKILKVGRIVTLLCFSYLPIAILGAAIALFPLLGFALTSAIAGAAFWLLVVLGLAPALVFCSVGLLKRSVVGSLLAPAEEWLRSCAQAQMTLSRTKPAFYLSPIGCTNYFRTWQTARLMSQ